MSGIVGVFNIDGAPVDRDLIARMAGPLSGRAPDGTGIWCSAHVGLGQAMLRIKGEPHEPDQPCTLDGTTWLAADARIDGREELVEALRARGEHAETDSPSATLILQAYRAFGDRFCDRLIGDFALVLWDS